MGMVTGEIRTGLGPSAQRDGGGRVEAVRGTRQAMVDGPPKQARG